MNKLFCLIIVIVTVFASCENVEDNNATIQATIDSVFFKSFDARGNREDGTVILQGLTNDEVITLYIAGFSNSRFELGGDNPSYATFEDQFGNIYSTDPFGSGFIEVTNRNIGNASISGEFAFQAVLPGIDTLFVEKGFFYEVPYGGTVDSTNPVNAGSFSAEVDNTSFLPVVVTATSSGNSILIAGTTSNSSILIRVPVEVENGNYSLPQEGFRGTYTINATPQESNLGNISIISHDTAEKKIRGTFSFQTENYSITNGQFNVTYQ